MVFIFFFFNDWDEGGKLKKKKRTVVQCLRIHLSFLVALVGKNPPANAGDARDICSIPGWGRSLGGGNGNPLQYSCLGNSMDRGAWRATVHGVTESAIVSTHTHTHVAMQGTWVRPLVRDLRSHMLRSS